VQRETSLTNIDKHNNLHIFHKLQIFRHMKENFLHYIWANRLFSEHSLSDENGNEIEIIDVGQKNNDAGPDFFNAKIKYEQTIWAGNIEIHLKSSDWNKHSHHRNKAYDNVILHVVYEHDTDVFNSKNQKLLTVKLKFKPVLLKKYNELLLSENNIACGNFINKQDDFIINSWLTRLITERIEQKTEYLKTILHFTNNNWEETFYISLANAFGFKTNSLPFELTAKSLPSLILAKNKTQLYQLEALLFGQAGFLSNENIDDEYYNSLKQEYKFLSSKYLLKPIDSSLWKFLRIRPVNFPTIRLSQFARLTYKSSHLFSKIIEIENIKEFYQFFEIKASEYWNNHYTFGEKSNFKIKNFGKSAIDNLLINTVLPILFLYGNEKGNSIIKERALNLFEDIKAENNHILKKWTTLGINIKNAYFSQSLMQLYNEYCMKRKCIDCRIGHLYLNRDDA